MTDCPFQYDSKTRNWYCPKCKEPTTIKYPCNKQLCWKPPRRKCLIPPTPEEIASQKAEAIRQEAEAIEIGKSLGWTFEDAIHWAVALVRWQKAGRPQRTDEEVQYIVWICEVCDDYKADEKRCRICRCGVSTGDMAICNKARLKTEHCPQNKW